MTDQSSGDTIRYPGGKGLLYQRLISLIPPHETYIEAFAGGGAVARNKLEARVNIAIDLDREALERLRSTIVRNGVGYPGNPVGSGEPAAPAEVSLLPAIPDPIARTGEPVQPGPLTRNGDMAGAWQFLNEDACLWLATYRFRGDEFVYADPPYLMETRKQQRRLYRYEMDESSHGWLLEILCRIRCNVMISGYYSEMYAKALTGWHTTTFETITRGGGPATEWVWMNYPPPVALHDYRYLGDGFRERERIKRKKRRWVEKLRKMDTLEKQAILAAISEMETESNGRTTTK